LEEEEAMHDAVEHVFGLPVLLLGTVKAATLDDEDVPIASRTAQ